MNETKNSFHSRELILRMAGLNRNKTRGTYTAPLHKHDLRSPDLCIEGEKMIENAAEGEPMNEPGLFQECFLR